MSAPRVLVVDDEEAVCWSLRRALARAGYEAEAAPSAEKALELAERHPPQAVLMDVRLPGMDGLSALARLRRIAPDAPVIVMTAFGDLTTAVRPVADGDLY